MEATDSHHRVRVMRYIDQAWTELPAAFDWTDDTIAEQALGPDHELSLAMTSNGEVHVAGVAVDAYSARHFIGTQLTSTSAGVRTHKPAVARYGSSICAAWHTRDRRLARGGQGLLQTRVRCF